MELVSKSCQWNWSGQSSWSVDLVGEVGQVDPVSWESSGSVAGVVPGVWLDLGTQVVLVARRF